ncbi:hypothetical protein CS022_21100 [Veronia nyctiphanis]|uniref:Major facilitator superfamily (MFS) profile domain-containing protein n=1 Tax=Veronia nyctiphanis TaxID=1278244 RepID=A0A4Q0YKS9_9GAMM|nr:MFS transporter [Veronia nyctiphanis]RXJ71330.1 hypothetical protein CS022_21100 [Veronia nyctiphanis]
MIRLPLLYIYNALSSALFYRGIFIIYLLDNGLDMTQVGVLQSLLFWTMVVVEVPSGYFADRYGRKKSLMASSILLILSAVGMLFSDQFYFFALVFILEALALSFNSGAGEALLFSFLKENGQEDEYLKHRSRISAISSVAMGLAIGLGGWLQKINFELVYIATIICVSISFFAIWAFQYESGGVIEEREKQESISIIKVLSNGGLTLNIFMLMIGLIIVEASMTMIFIYGQFVLPTKGISTEYIALTYSILQFLAAGVYLSSNFLTNRFGFRPVVITSLLLTSIIYVCFIESTGLLAVTLFLMLIMVPEIICLPLEDYFQKFLPEEKRATLLSFKSMLTSLITTLNYLVFGWMFTMYSVDTTLYTAFTYLFIAILFVLVVIYIEKRSTTYVHV